MPHRRPRGRGGMALMMAIVITGVCAAIATGLMVYIISEYRATHLDWRRVQALYCAEAGVEYAMQFVRAGEALPSGEIALSDAGISGAEGSFQVRIQAVTSGSTTDPADARQITAIGYVPSKAEVDAGKGVSRTVVAVVSRGVWNFGTDAVRARNGVYYGSNNNLTVVVDNNDNLIPTGAVDASVRVTGISATIGSVASLSANKASVAGTVTAPGSVDIGDGSGSCKGVSELKPENYIDNAFPPADVIGYDDSDPANLIWEGGRPAPGSMADAFYQEAAAGGTLSHPVPGTTIVGPKVIDMGGPGNRLTGVVLQGPGTIFVNGDIGPIINGPPPAQIVVRGILFTQGGEVYRTIPSSPGKMAPPLIILGRGAPDSEGNCPAAQCDGNSEWHLGGPLMTMNPSGTVVLNDSAFNAPTSLRIGVCGALISNGKIFYKSSKAALGYPAAFAGQLITMPGLPLVRSYTAR